MISPAWPCGPTWFSGPAWLPALLGPAQLLVLLAWWWCCLRSRLFSFAVVFVSLPADEPGRRTFIHPLLCCQSSYLRLSTSRRSRPDASDRMSLPQTPKAALMSVFACLLLLPEDGLVSVPLSLNFHRLLREKTVLFL